KDYEHRKQWIQERLKLLSETFAVEVCAYAIMSNHVHTVLRLQPVQAEAWSEEQVINRWQQLFSLPVLIERYQRGQCDTPAQQQQAKQVIAQWRERLSDLSWFMRCLNEPIARQANHEDKCTGRFWEGRFKSQALLNEQAVLACMAYVDLNPIRANLCQSLEDSEFTSIMQRIEQIKQQSKQTTVKLTEFIGNKEQGTGIPFSLTDYLELTDWTGRCIHPKKKGFIPPNTPKILHQLGLDEANWLETVTSFKSKFHSFVGSEQQLKTTCEQYQKQWTKGISLCRRLFASIDPIPA
ncbi:MAG: transposase, partial [Gammaproteobacteria bacterium]|nr:transposase [Gammaproteobacteria bacterium]